MHLVLCLGGGLPLLPLDLGPARGVGVPLGCRLGRAGSLPLLLLLRERAKWELPARCRLPFPAPPMSLTPQFSPHVPRRGNSRESSASCSRILSSRGSRSSDRGSRKDKRARSRESSSLGRRRRCRSRSSSRSRSRGRERRRWSSSSSLSSRARSRRERSRSFDRYRSRRGSSRSRSSDRYRSRRDRSLSVDRYRSRRQRTRSPARRGGRRDRSRSPALSNHLRDRSLSSVRLPGSPTRLRAEETGWLARRETQEGVGAVASQPPVVSEAAAAVTPVAGWAALTALPSAVQDLARFFLGLSGSSSLGTIGGIAG